MRIRLVAALAAAVLATGCSAVGTNGIYDMPLPGGADLGDHPYRVTVQFADVLDLVPQAAVKVNDVVVGRVESIGFDDKSYQARVTLALENRYAFPKDSSLKILTSGLLGEQYIGVEAGADEKTIAPGDTITSTQSAVVLENLIGQFLYNKAADGASSTGTAPKK